MYSGGKKMKINEEYIRNNYKSIQKTCFENGETIPMIIQLSKKGDTEHLSKEEKEKLDMNYITSLKLIENYRETKKNETLILHKKHEKYDTLGEYWSDQLDEFIKKYPQFEKIIEE